MTARARGDVRAAAHAVPACGFRAYAVRACAVPAYAVLASAASAASVASAGCSRAAPVPSAAGSDAGSRAMPLASSAPAASEAPPSPVAPAPPVPPIADVPPLASAPTGPPWSPDAAVVRPDPPTAAGFLSPPSSGEARRASLAALSGDPLLAPFAGALRDHFGAKPGPFAVQRIDLAGGRSAVLVSRSDESDPIVLAVDRDVVAWSKPHPVGGMTPPVLHLAIAPRPDGGVVLFGYVAALHLLAARMWADDGNAFAEIELGSFDACDALSAAYAPGAAWIIACSSPSGVRAQRLQEDGTTSWGNEGIAVGPSSAAGPASIVPHGHDVWTLVTRARGVGADHALAWRYDARARSLWAGPVDLGALAPSRIPLAEDRLDARAVQGEGVRVAVPRPPAGKPLVAVEIAPDGGVRPQSR